MSEYRHDPISDNWVIIAFARSERPDEFGVSRWYRAATTCPFCIGQESETPPEIARYALPGEALWRVRVVPNKYPAVAPASSNGRVRSAPFRKLAGRGVHEVIIESPTHVVSLTDLPETYAQLAFRAYADRLTAMRREPKMAYGVVFKNVGPEAGASLEHVHSQVLATTLVPQTVAAQHARWKRKNRTGNVFERFLAEEMEDGSRVGAQSERFVALCPFASRVPYEVRVLPIRHAAYFERTDPAHLDELARLVRDIFRRIEAATSHGPYNFIIHTAPFDTGDHDYYYWHIEILPRLTRTAGFEWGSGCYINPLPPEVAADRLRQL